MRQLGRKPACQFVPAATRTASSEPIEWREAPAERRRISGPFPPGQRCELVPRRPGTLAQALASECLLETPLLAWLHIVRVPLHIFDDVFLLHLALKPAQRGFKHLVGCNVNLSQELLHPPFGIDSPTRGNGPSAFQALWYTLGLTRARGDVRCREEASKRGISLKNLSSQPCPPCGLQLVGS